MKQILSIQQEVYDVEKRILGILDLIRKDGKEKLRVNETLMGLLFKLDSVRGVGAGVRECRKAVIKKVIFLQEIIDGSDQKTTVIEDSGEPYLSESTARNVEADMGDENKALEILGAGDVDTEHYANDSTINNCMAKDLDSDTMIEESEVLNEPNSSEKSGGNSGADVADQAVEVEIECPNPCMETVDDLKNELRCNSEADKDEEDYCIVKKVVGEIEGEDYNTTPIANQFAEDCSIDETTLSEQEDDAKATKGDNLKDREMMERMIEENAKMMSMMKELAEQNRAQTEMLGLLSQRVEQLEKALICEKLRKKMKAKKKRAARGEIDDLDCSPDQKKCGKK